MVKLLLVAMIVSDEWYKWLMDGCCKLDESRIGDRYGVEERRCEVDWRFEMMLSWCWVV